MKRRFHSFATWPVRRFNLTGRTAVVAGPFIWLLLFFLVPFLLVVKISFADLQLGIPPYTRTHATSPTARFTSRSTCRITRFC